jgi:hypothetical protein
MRQQRRIKGTQFEIDSEEISKIPTQQNLQHIPKMRNKRMKLKGTKEGRWSQEEHIQFLKAFKVHGNDWKSVIFFFF